MVAISLVSLISLILVLRKGHDMKMLDTVGHTDWRGKLVCICVATLLALPTACSGADTPDSESRPSNAVVVDVSDLDEPIAVRTWLVAGPIPNPGLAAPRGFWPDSEGFDKDLLQSAGGEASFRATERAKVKIDNRDFMFIARTWNTPYIDFTELYGRRGDASVYLYVEIESDEEQRVYLHVGSNDAVKMWIDGEVFLSVAVDRRASRSQNVVAVVLPKGRTPVLLRIDQDNNDWGAFFEVAKESVLPSSFPANLSARLRRAQLQAVQLQAARVETALRLSGQHLTTITGATADDRPPSTWLLALSNLLQMKVLGIFALILIFGLPVSGLVLIAWFLSRHATERDQLRNEAIKVMADKGLDPQQVESALRTEPPSGKPRRDMMIAWSLVLALGGFGLTVAEIAHAGLGNAGFELFVMLAGVALLISTRLIHGDSEH
jgi:hypothetical protein